MCWAWSARVGRFDSLVGVERYITLSAGTSHHTFNQFNGIKADLIKGFEPKKLVVGPADLSPAEP